MDAALSTNEDEDLRIDLSVIIDYRNRRQWWTFGGGFISLFCLAMGFVGVPVLYTHFTLPEAVGLFVLVCILGCLLGWALTEYIDGGNANRVYEGLLDDLNKKDAEWAKWDTFMNKRDAESPYCKLLSEIQDEARIRWHVGRPV